MADQTALVTMIDAALERFGSRDLVSGAEVLDFLLDLRLAIPDTPDALEQLLEEESQPDRLGPIRVPSPRREERPGRAR